MRRDSQVSTNTVSAIVDSSTVVVVDRSGNTVWNDTFDFSSSTLCFDDSVRAPSRARSASFGH